MNMEKIILLSITIIYLSGCSMFGVRNEEGPKYEVLTKNDTMEIRKYSPYIVATTQVEGSFKETQNKGFRILAGYIFGANEKLSKISMTAPVLMNPQKSESEKIAMTAPVIQSPTKTGWEMSFMMPSKYTKLEQLPRPKDDRINLKEVPAKLMAVVQFTGLWSDEKNQKMASQLKTWLTQLEKYDELTLPMFAGYDPPWTLPFLRRNEMMIEVRPK
jgi:hypothetical protein